MANVENFEEMVGTREAEAAEVATESGRAVATESGGAATTGDETVATAGDETAATGGVMYADEGPYTIDVRHVEEMVAESGGDETATRPGTRPAVPGTRPVTRLRRRLVTNETVATGGVMYTDEGEFEFDEHEMAALEGHRFVAEFTRCTRWPGQSSNIDPVKNAANVKKALCI